MGNVFISHTADTKPLAEELVRALQREGIQSWADFKDLKPGQRWNEEIENALNRARWLVILVGPESQASPRLEAEWRAALTKAWSDSGTRLVPIVVGSGTPPPFLRRWVPLHVDPSEAQPPWTAQVLQVLQSGGDRAIRELPDSDREERRERLDQIGRMTEELRSRKHAGSDS